MKTNDVKNDFYAAVTDWLLPQGYTETYKNWEATEWHFIKDKIRVVCVFEGTQSYCIISKDFIFEGAYYGIKSEKFKPFCVLDERLQRFKRLLTLSEKTT